MERREPSPPLPTTVVTGNSKLTSLPRWALLEDRLCGDPRVKLSLPASVCRCHGVLSEPYALLCSIYAFGSLVLFSLTRSLTLPVGLCSLCPSSPLGVRGWFIWPVLVTTLFLIISAIWAVLSRQASPQLNR